MTSLPFDPALPAADPVDAVTGPVPNHPLDHRLKTLGTVAALATRWRLLGRLNGAGKAVRGRRQQAGWPQGKGMEESAAWRVD